MTFEELNHHAEKTAQIVNIHDGTNTKNPLTLIFE